jgi:hypothetical protein
MLAPIPILHNPAALLGDVRMVLNLRPALADFPVRLAEYLEADEPAVRECLDVLYLEGWLCP